MRGLNHYFDKIIDLIKFIWKHRYGNKNIVAFKCYIGVTLTLDYS